RHRHRFCHDGTPPGGPAGIPRPDGQRPCRRAGVALMDWARHLLIVPILVPLMTGAALLLIDETRHALKAVISTASTLLLLAVALTLMLIANDVPEGSGALASSYAVAGWPAPFAIVLVLDRLSAL